MRVKTDLVRIITLLGCVALAVAHAYYLEGISLLMLFLSFSSACIALDALFGRYYWTSFFSLLLVLLFRFDRFIWLNWYGHQKSISGGGPALGVAEIFTYPVIDLLVLVPLGYLCGWLLHRYLVRRSRAAQERA